MKQEQIDRINELYHKSQAVGLTDAEKEEQAALRKQYVADIKASLRGEPQRPFKQYLHCREGWFRDRSWKEIRKCWKNRKLNLEIRSGSS